MCNKLQRRAARLSKNLIVSIGNLHVIDIQREEIYTVIEIFEIKRIQFSIAIKRLVIDYYSFWQQSEYCIVYRSPPCLHVS